MPEVIYAVRLIARFSSTQLPDPIMVDLWNPKRRALPWFWLGFIALAIAVFTWGLGYKLSLYDPPQAKSHEIPQAKLLSKNEQAIAVQSPLLKNTKDPSTALRKVLAGVVLFFAVTLGRQMAATFHRNMPDTGTPCLSRRFAALTSFFFRPPPVLS